MLSLSNTLLAAQKSASSVPYVKVEVLDRVAGVNRLGWTRLYTGSEADYHHAATSPGDGSLVRARIDPATFNLYIQRVASPGPGSDYSTWTLVGQVSSASPVALGSRGATVLLFYAGIDQVSLYVKESTDYSASFGAPTLVYTETAVINHLAAAINASGTVALFYSVASGSVYSVKRTSGTWGAPSAWSNSIASISGLGCYYEGDWNLIVTGQEASGDRKVWTCIFGDGFSQAAGTWSALGEVTLASSGSGVEFKAPSIASPDVPRMFFVESYSGSVAYSRPVWSHSLPLAEFSQNLWREPVPFDLLSEYGVALACSASTAWLSAPSGVWQASLSAASVEVTADVLEATVRTEQGLGDLRVVLRNDDGRYGGIGAGDLAAIKQGSEVRLGLGYVTPSGAEVAYGPGYNITGWEYTSEGGKATFVLHAVDGWGVLDAWVARRQFSWAAGDRNVFQLLSFIFARAGLALSSISASSAVTDLHPAFTIHPGESGASAVQRLMKMVEDVILFRGFTGYLKRPQASDTSDYAYGTGHAIFHGRYSSTAQGCNRVQVFGDGVVDEAFEWAQIAVVHEKLRQVHDLNLSTPTEAGDRAQVELRRAQTRAEGGEVAVPVNCGQELFDVVDITDSRAGLAAAKRRVVGISVEYRTGPRPRYAQVLKLSGV